MSQIHFPKKPRKQGAGLFTDKDGSRIFIGKDYALQNEIDETKRQTQERACFKGCNTCGACANSRRDCSYPKSYDANAKKNVDCRACEKFRYHDCHNGFMRDTHQNAEPFTPDVIELIRKTGGKPLID